MRPVADHAQNIQEIVTSYLDDEVGEYLCDYIRGVRREAWIEAREKVLANFPDNVDTWWKGPAARDDINAVFDEMMEEKNDES